MMGYILMLKVGRMGYMCVNVGFGLVRALGRGQNLRHCRVSVSYEFVVLYMLSMGYQMEPI